MTVQITIRNVSEEVRDGLAARAASKRQSMQQFLQEELERIASSGSHSAAAAEKDAVASNAALLERIRRRVDASGRGVSIEAILAARDADKK